MSDRTLPEITPELLLKAYAAGIFPMAESADDPSLHWIEPRYRGVLPLDGFETARSLRKAVRADRFKVTADRAFDAVIAACAAPVDGRMTTWINQRIQTIYGDLHRAGHAHSIEVWNGEALVGGLYGVSLGAAFFGESMFHSATDASKIALVHLMARLRIGGYQLLDTQFVTPHLMQFGVKEIPRERYKKLLAAAIRQTADFLAAANPLCGQEALAALSSAPVESEPRLPPLA
jgi:leucyl/phenylalanyl-tRNA---protein transferase